MYTFIAALAANLAALLRTRLCRLVQIAWCAGGTSRSSSSKVSSPAKLQTRLQLQLAPAVSLPLTSKSIPLSSRPD